MILQQEQLLEHPTVQRYLSKQQQEEEDGLGEGENEMRGYIVEDHGDEIDLS